LVLRVGLAGLLGVVSLHKLTAGSGYDYLPRQVAPMDSTQAVGPGMSSGSRCSDRAPVPVPVVVSITRRAELPQMHWVCGRWGCLRYPLLMTGEEVRDIGIGAGVGPWVLQEMNGSGIWRGQVGVIAGRPDGCLRHGRR